MILPPCKITQKFLMQEAVSQHFYGEWLRTFNWFMPKGFEKYKSRHKKYRVKAFEKAFALQHKNLEAPN